MSTSRRDFVKQLEAVAVATGLPGVVSAEPKERKSEKSVAATPAGRPGRWRKIKLLQGDQ